MAGAAPSRQVAQGAVGTIPIVLSKQPDDDQLHSVGRWHRDYLDQRRVDDFLDLLTDWGPCADQCCLSDLDLDGDVGITDFLTLLANWTR